MNFIKNLSFKKEALPKKYYTLLYGGCPTITQITYELPLPHIKSDKEDNREGDCDR